MFVGAQIVDPELVCPRFLGGWFAVEIVEDLQAALAQFAEIAADLKR